jgi:hypothetical protein
MAPPSKKPKKVSTPGSYNISDTAKKTPSKTTPSKTTPSKTTPSKKVGRPSALKERKKRTVRTVFNNFLIYFTSKVGTVPYGTKYA